MHWAQILGAVVLGFFLFSMIRRLGPMNRSLSQEKVILNHFTRRLTPLRHEDGEKSFEVSLDQLLTDNFVGAYTMFPTFEQMSIHSPVNLKGMVEMNPDELEQLNLFVRENSRFYEWIDLLRKSMQYGG